MSFRADACSVVFIGELQTPDNAHIVRCIYVDLYVRTAMRRRQP